MKTPMQELIDRILSDESPILIDTKGIKYIFNVKDLIEKEKQMIIDAYVNRDDLRGHKALITKQERAEQYYNKTFKQ